MTSTASPKRDYIAIARGYEADVLEGKVPACVFVKQAIRRNCADLEQFESAGAYVYSEEEGARVCRFIELLTHTIGCICKAPLILSPPQTTLCGMQIASITHRFEAFFCCLKKLSGTSSFGLPCRRKARHQVICVVRLLPTG